MYLWELSYLLEFILNEIDQSSVLDFLLNEIEYGTTSKHYAFPLASRLKQHAGSTRNNTNITVMNFYDMSVDLSENFYCETITDAHHIYKAICNSETSIHESSVVRLRNKNLTCATCKVNRVDVSTKS